MHWLESCTLKVADLFQQAALSFRVAAADAPAKQRLDAFLAGKMPQASRARLQVNCCQSA